MCISFSGQERVKWCGRCPGVQRSGHQSVAGSRSSGGHHVSAVLRLQVPVPPVIQSHISQSLPGLTCSCAVSVLRTGTLRWSSTWRRERSVWSCRPRGEMLLLVSETSYTSKLKQLMDSHKKSVVYCFGLQKESVCQAFSRLHIWDCFATLKSIIVYSDVFIRHCIFIMYLKPRKMNKTHSQ